MQLKCEMISCADGGPTPPSNMPDDSFYVGVFDEQGTILEDFFNNEADASVHLDRLIAAGVEDATGYGARVRTKIVTVHLLLLVDDNEEAADGVNEILREHQRKFAPTSCLLDYSFGTASGTYPNGPTVDPDTYEEGAAFE